MKNVNLILGTMTFGESVFSPDVEAFVNAFLGNGRLNKSEADELIGLIESHMTDE